jgi:methylenetetrahydrofolate dehydrogenase (NADP+) / methenyltetrahydrofolate cyclohydrolase
VHTHKIIRSFRAVFVELCWWLSIIIPSTSFRVVAPAGALSSFWTVGTSSFLFQRSILVKMSSQQQNLDTTTSTEDKIIDGKAIAATIRAELKARVATMAHETGHIPGLAVILVGSRHDSQTYVRMKKKACAAAGIASTGYDFQDTVTEQELLACVHRLNADDTVHGILIQLPLPAHLNQQVIMQAVDPAKDVDGLHPTNVAALQLYAPPAATSSDATVQLLAPFSIPCTPLGCLTLLDRSLVTLTGKHCVVLGRSQLVGLPMARLLLSRDATVTIVHSKSQNIPQLLQQADVIVAAVGRPGLVRGEWLKPGAVVIDVGINSVECQQSEPHSTNEEAATMKKPTYRLVGDVDYDSALPVVSKITPVPGGVGPMTIAMLLQNTVAACERAIRATSVAEAGTVNPASTATVPVT